MRQKTVSLEIIIPVFNEEKVIPLLLKTLEKAFSLKNLKKNKIRSLSYVFVDDGSQDKTLELLKKS